MHQNSQNTIEDLSLLEETVPALVTAVQQLTIELSRLNKIITNQHIDTRDKGILEGSMHKPCEVVFLEKSGKEVVHCPAP